MTVTGPCQICQHAEARHTCDHCGTIVCEDHWDAATHACTKCAERVTDGTDSTDLER